MDLFWTIALSNSMRTYGVSESVFSNAWEMLLLTVLLCWLWLVSYLKGYIHKVIFSLSCFCLIKISINHKEIRNNDFCDDTRCPDCIFFLFWEFIHLHQQLFVEDGLSIVLISFLSFTLLKKLFTQIQYFLVILLISFFKLKLSFAIISFWNPQELRYP